jgi:hypothetical protein
MILNKSEAEAVYSAMCAMNNVNGVALGLYIASSRERGGIKIEESYGGSITILSNEVEVWKSQSEFAAAYGL